MHHTVELYILDFRSRGEKVTSMTCFITSYIEVTLENNVVRYDHFFVFPIMLLIADLV